MVEIFEAARAEDRFAGPPQSGCIPHDCLDQVLNAATADDMDWLATSDAALIKSDLIPRLPANIVHIFMFDLVRLLDLDPQSMTAPQTLLSARVQAAMTDARAE